MSKVVLSTIKLLHDDASQGELIHDPKKEWGGVADGHECVFIEGADEVVAITGPAGEKQSVKDARYVVAAWNATPILAETLECIHGEFIKDISDEERCANIRKVLGAIL